MKISRLPDAYTPTPNLLKNRVILVTGAGAGIGRALSKSIAEYGGTVILCGRTLQRLESVYDEIVNDGGPTPAILPLDLSKIDPDYLQTLVEGIHTDYGRLDGLVHNAGILGQRTPVASYQPSVWREVMEVNVNAAFQLTQSCLPLLNVSPDARLVFTSSGVGRKGRAFWGGYSVAKFAIEGLTQVLAEECEEATNIKVNCINPGATKTAMRALAYPAEDPQKVTEASSLMPTYLYLLGPDSAQEHGQSFDAQ